MNQNKVCVVDCCVQGDHSIATRFLSELTGRPEGDCREGATWSIDNKYYQAEVLVEVKGGPVGEDWEAIIVLCDLSEPLSVKKAYSVWEGCGDETTPPVNLLVGVVSGLTEAKEKRRSEAVQWCLGRGVELVTWETNPSPTQTEDEDDDFPESVGVPRVSEALQAHMWPDMVLKTSKSLAQGGGGTCPNDDGEDDGKRSRSNCELNGMDKRTQDCTGEACPTSKTRGDGSTAGHTGASVAESSSSKARLDNLLGASDIQLLERGLDVAGDDGGEDFESLFARFAEMKTHAQSLPHEERKAYAEKVVMSFWKAIGGDEDEVCVDSSSDSEHNS